MFNASPTKDPIVFMTFEKDEEESKKAQTLKWKRKSKELVFHPIKKKDLLQNSFIIEDNLLLVITKFSIHFLTRDLKLVKS